MEDSLQNTFTEEVTATIYFDSVPDDADRECLLQQFTTVAETQNRKVAEVSEYVNAVFVTHNVGNEIELFDNSVESYDGISNAKAYDAGIWACQHIAVCVMPCDHSSSVRGYLLYCV